MVVARRQDPDSRVHSTTRGHDLTGARAYSAERPWWRVVENGGSLLTSAMAAVMGSTSGVAIKTTPNASAAGSELEIATGYAPTDDDRATHMDDDARSISSS